MTDSRHRSLKLPYLVRAMLIMSVILVLGIGWFTWNRYVRPQEHSIETVDDVAGMYRVIERFIHDEGETIKNREIVGLSQRIGSDLEHLVIVRTDRNSTYGFVLQHRKPGWTITGVTMKNDHKAIVGGYDLAKIRIYPRAWDRATGEILTRSMVNELETPSE